MKFFLPFCLVLVLIGSQIQAQNTTLTPSLFSPPRLSYDAIIALTSMQEGDMVFDITFKCLRVYVEGKWLCSTPSPNTYIPNMMAIISAGGTSTEYGQSVTVDGSGNIYVTGYFTGTATFGSTSKTSVGNNDIFVAKYSKSGDLQWVQSAGGVSDDYGFSIAVDTANNVYVTGFYHGLATFESISKTSTGGTDIFVVKYNSNGSVQWVQSAGGVNNDYSQAIALDNSGGVYIIGYYQDTVYFGDFSKASKGGYDIFLTKYNSFGTIEWVQSAGGTSNDLGYSMAIDNSENVYVTGFYQGTANFGAISKTSVGANDMFIAKYNPAIMSWSWVQSAGGTNNEFGQSIAIDSNGNVFVAGIYAGTATFNGFPSISKSSAGKNDIFIVKYNSLGHLQWVESAGGTEDDYSQAIAVDDIGNAFVTGYYYGTTFFGGISKTAFSQGYTDIFVAKCNALGKFQWVQSAGGIFGDYGKGISVDSSGNVYVTGAYSSTATFDRNVITAAGSGDIFVVRIDK